MMRNKNRARRATLPTVYLDEDVPLQVSNFLRKKGIVVQLAKDVMPLGTEDPIHPLMVSIFPKFHPGLLIAIFPVHTHPESKNERIPRLGNTAGHRKH